MMQPRQFTRLGAVPTGSGFGAPLGAGTQGPLVQPFGDVALVPQGNPSNYFSRHTTPTPLINNSLSMAQPRATVVPGSLGGGGATPAFQIFGSFLDNIQVDFLMRATQLDVRSSSVQAPRVVVTNGEVAELEISTGVSYVASPGFAPVAGAIPISTGGQFLGAAGGGNNPQIGQATRGQTLIVAPQVSSDRRYVKLHLQPIVTDVRLRQIPVQQGALSTFFEVPENDITRISTTATVPDGGTLLLGGLKLAAETEVEAGVPILSKIPLIKRAFTNRSRVKDEFILLVLVKPSIIIQGEEEDEAFPGLEAPEVAALR